MDYKLFPNFNSDGSYSGIQAHVNPDHLEPFKLDVSDLFDYVRTEIIQGKEIVVLVSKPVS
jgi:hypothetical protein